MPTRGQAGDWPHSPGSHAVHTRRDRLTNARAVAYQPRKHTRQLRVPEPESISSLTPSMPSQASVCSGFSQESREESARHGTEQPAAAATNHGHHGHLRTVAPPAFRAESPRAPLQKSQPTDGTPPQNRRGRRVVASPDGISCSGPGEAMCIPDAPGTWPNTLPRSTNVALFCP